MQNRKDGTEMYAWTCVYLITTIEWCFIYVQFHVQVGQQVDGTYEYAASNQIVSKSISVAKHAYLIMHGNVT